jgi:hypothetical protein
VKSRSELLIDCLLAKKVITASALYTLAYEPHGLQKEQLLLDLKDFDCISRIEIKDHELFIPSPLAQGKMILPSNPEKYLDYAAFAGLAAHVLEEGGKWMEFPRKQIHNEVIPRSAKGFMAEGEITLAMIDPHPRLIPILLSVVHKVLILTFKEKQFALGLSNVQCFEALDFLR